MPDDVPTCTNGHPKTPENWRPRMKLGKQTHVCAPCARESGRRIYAARKAGISGRRGDTPNFPCGHPRTPENSKGGGNQCKECNRIRQIAHYRASRAAEGKEIYRPDPDWFPCGHPRVAANLTVDRYCRICRMEAGRRRYAEGKMPTKGDPEVRRRRAQASLQCARDERADPDTADYVQIVRRDPCPYCGDSGGTRDHVIPMSDGGPNHWENYTGACLSCNVSKSDTPLLMFLLDRMAIRRARESSRSA